MAALLLLSALAYGYAALSEPLEGEVIKISVVQGNIEQIKKWDTKYARSIMRTYADLTEEASREEPDLIVWPEAATPYAVDRDQNMYKLVRRITEKAGAPLLVGSSSRQKYATRRERAREMRNSAILLTPGRGAGMQRYNKIHLLPFAEYLPLKGKVPWSVIGISDPGNYVPGEEFTVFQGPAYSFVATICWETIFPELVRKFVLAGGQFIVNITNEAWFGKTESPHQFVSMNVFRAVENGRYVVRCGNTGVSCFIDPRGRIVDRIQDEGGQDTFLRGVLTGSVVPLGHSTFYTRHGDWFAWLCAVLSVVLILASLMRRFMLKVRKAVQNRAYRL
jgi:apolipoprotein N-acyltransferase